MNGVEGMLYMYSQATSAGALTLTITFALGTDLDNAGEGPEPGRQTLPRLPQDGQRIGVTTERRRPTSSWWTPGRTENTTEMLYLSNYPPAGEGRAVRSTASAR